MGEMGYPYGRFDASCGGRELSMWQAVVIEFFSSDGKCVVVIV